MKLLILLAIALLLFPFTGKCQDTLALKDTSVLKQVIVTGSKKMLVNKNGNILVNVENTPLSSTPDAVNLLSKLPAIQVSPDGEKISVIGKGTPLIYIDNQKMSVEDLKSLPVSDIKTIELINDPSSKYEADGRMVILITRKSNKKEGWKADFTETAAYRKYYLNRFSANVNYRRKKLELKGNLQYNQLKTWEGNSFDFQIPGHSIKSDYSVTAVTTRPQFIGEAGAFYQVSNGDYISLSVNGKTQNESFPINTASSFKDATHSENVVTNAFSHSPNSYYTSKLNYNKKIRNGSLFIGAQQTNYIKNRRSTIMNNYESTSYELSQKRRELTGIHVLAGRIDFEKSFSDKIKWEIGTTATHARSSGSSDIDNYNPASAFNSDFNYDEKNYAAYTQASGKLKKISYSAGVRMENTNVISNYDDHIAPSSINKKTTKLFPKASLTIPVDSSKNITFNYSKSINRPDYSNANQTAVYINPYFEWTNNINLNPSITDEVRASFQFQDYSLAMSVYRTRGPIYSNFIYNDNESILRRSEMNYDSEYGTQLTANIPFKYKIWSSVNVMQAMYSIVKDSQAVTGKARPFFYFYSSNEFRLPNNFLFTVSGWAVTRQYQGALERSPVFQVDTSITKSLSKNFTCTVRFSDIFRSLNNNGEKFAINDVAANGVFRDNVRELAVALKYSIGKLKESRYQNKDIDENGNRIR